MNYETELYSQLRDGVFVVSAQVDPPLVMHLGDFDKEIGLLRQAGIKVVDINSRSKLSLDS